MRTEGLSSAPQKKNPQMVTAISESCKNNDVKEIEPSFIANKCDILDDELFDVAEFEEFVRENEWQLMYVSAATGEGLREMIETVYDRLQTLPPILTYEAEEVEPEEVVGKETIIRREGGRFVVEGQWIFNLMNQVNFDDYESLNYFQRVLQRSGVFEQLEAAGCQDGDTVSMYEFEFDYVK